MLAEKLEKAEADAEAVWKEVYDPENKPDVTPPESEVSEQPPVVEEPPPEEPPKEPPKEDPKKDAVYWENRFKTVEGILKVEQQRLGNEVSQWRDYANALTSKITQLEERLNKTTSEPEADPDISAMETEYPDFAKVMKKIKDDHRKEIADLRREMQTTVSADLKGVREDLQVSKQDRFSLSLQQMVPGWKEIDKEPAFMEWLNAVVPYTGTTKLALLQNAARNFNAEGVAQFFFDFIKETKGSEPETVVPPDSDKLDKFTAPPRSGGPAVPKTGGQQGLTKAQYAKFMDPRYKFNPRDWGGKTEQQVEAMFDASIQKGTLF